MEVTDIIGAGELAAENEATAGTLGQEDFLRMLIAQLEHQDPLNPQESTEFTAQLAQFSSLEQLVGMRESIDGLASRFQTDRTESALSMIGREVFASSDVFDHAGGEGTLLQYELGGQAETVQLQISGPDGSVLRRIDVDPQDRTRGIHALEWDGKSDSGVQLNPGVYGLQVVATTDLNPVPASGLVRGIITGANLQSSEPSLLLGDLALTLDDIREVREP